MRSLTEALLRKGEASTGDATTTAQSLPSATKIRLGNRYLTPAGNLATVIEQLGHGDYLLRYDLVLWPMTGRRIERSESSYVTLTRDFINQYCRSQ
jgi:hypothetical protein